MVLEEKIKSLQDKMWVQHRLTPKLMLLEQLRNYQAQIETPERKKDELAAQLHQSKNIVGEKQNEVSQSDGGSNYDILENSLISVTKKLNEREEEILKLKVNSQQALDHALNELRSSKERYEKYIKKLENKVTIVQAQKCMTIPTGYACPNAQDSNKLPDIQTDTMVKLERDTETPDIQVVNLLKEKELLTSLTKRLQSQQCSLSSQLEDREAQINFLKENNLFLSESQYNLQNKYDTLMIEYKKLQTESEIQKESINILRQSDAEKLLRNTKEKCAQEVEELRQNYDKQILNLKSQVEKGQNLLRQSSNMFKLDQRTREENLRLHYVTEMQILREQLIESQAQDEKNKLHLETKWRDCFNEYRKEMMKHVDELQTKIKSCKESSRVAELLKENESLLLRIRELETEKGEFTKKILLKIRKKDQDVDEMKTDLRRLVEELQKMKMELVKKERLVEALQQTIEAQCEERCDLNKKLAELTSEKELESTMKQDGISLFQEDVRLHGCSKLHQCIREGQQICSPIKDPYKLECPLHSKMNESELYQKPVGPSSSVTSSISHSSTVYEFTVGKGRIYNPRKIKGKKSIQSPVKHVSWK